MLRGTTHEQNKKELINLIKTLPESEIFTVRKFVENVISKNQKPAPKKNKGNKTLEEFLANVPEDDEELSPEFKKKLKKLSKEAKKEFKEGKTISLGELKKQYGL